MSVRNKIDSSSGGIPQSPVAVTKSMHSSGKARTSTLEGKTLCDIIGYG